MFCFAQYLLDQCITESEDDVNSSEYKVSYIWKSFDIITPHTVQTPPKQPATWYLKLPPA